MVITAMEADPPRDYHRVRRPRNHRPRATLTAGFRRPQATDVLEECHREVDNMTPKQLKAAFVPPLLPIPASHPAPLTRLRGAASQTRRPQSLRRPASMHGHLPAADLERRPSIDTATDSEAATDDERDAPSPVSPGHHVVEYYKPSGRPLSSVSSVSSIAQDDRHANPYARPPTPLSPLRPHGHAGDRSSPKAPSSLMGGRGSISDDDNGGEGPSTWYEERHPGTEHRQQEARLGRTAAPGASPSARVSSRVRAAGRRTRPCAPPSRACRRSARWRSTGARPACPPSLPGPRA